MKIILLILLSCVSYLASAQQAALDNIPLSWTDFQVKPMQGNQTFTAHISTSINYEVVTSVKDGKILYAVQTECFIDRSRSFVDAVFFDRAYPSEKQKLLDHEKLHLVICFIQHKRFANMLKVHKFSGSIKQELDSLFSVIVEDIRRQNLAYDNETNHGLNALQGKWEKELLTQLYGLYEGSTNYFAAAETPLECRISPTKLKDPLNLDYQNAFTAFEYNFENNRINITSLQPGFPISMEAPFYKTADSNICVEGDLYPKNRSAVK